MAIYDYYHLREDGGDSAWDRSQAVSSRPARKTPPCHSPQPWNRLLKDPTKPMILAALPA